MMARLEHACLKAIWRQRAISGADSLITFMRITLPYLRPALIGAGVFCMLISFDDFIRSFFLGGYEPTLPVLIFAKLRSGMSPEINAISTVVSSHHRSTRAYGPNDQCADSEKHLDMTNLSDEPVSEIVRIEHVSKRFGDVLGSR